jgi:beta-barrel assembly-enhancing protease
VDNDAFLNIGGAYMKNIHKYLSPIAVFLCIIMILPAMHAQSAGSSNTGKSVDRHRDIQNIGKRDVTGRIFRVLPNQLSLDKEIAWGRQAASEFEQTVQFLKDPAIAEYVDRLGQNLVRRSDAKIPFQIKVVNTDRTGDMGVFTFPGGFLYVNSSLIIEAGNEPELAGAMAHAIAHVCARHSTRLQSMKNYLQLTAGPAAPADEKSAQAVQDSFDLSTNLNLLGTNREFEAEADQLGIQYLWNAGYNPHAFVLFLEKMQAQEKEARFLRTHPSPENRIAQCLEEEKALPKKDSYIANWPEFDRIKAKLLAEIRK